MYTSARIVDTSRKMTCLIATAQRRRHISNRHVITRRISAPAHWLCESKEPQSRYHVAQEVQRESVLSQLTSARHDTPPFQLDI